MLRTSINAYKKYLSTRQVASADSNKRVKAINFNAIAALKDFDNYLFGDKADEKKDAMHVSLLAKMRNYRPTGVSVAIHQFLIFIVEYYIIIMSPKKNFFPMNCQRLLLKIILNYNLLTNRQFLN